MTIRKLVGSRAAHVPSADWNLSQVVGVFAPSVGIAEIRELERTAAGALGVEPVIFGSGRTAIWAALKTAPHSLRRAWVPAYTCVAVPNAVRAAGLDIQWTDVVGPNIDMSSVLARAEPGDAVIAQHTYGIPIDPSLIRQARAQGLFIVEDRAHQFDASDFYGDALVLSLEHSKIVSGGLGGVLHCRNPSQARAVRLLRDRLPQMSEATARRVVLTSLGQLAFDWHVPILDRLGSGVRRALLRIPATSFPGQSPDEMAGAGIEPTSLSPRLARIAVRGIQRLAANLEHRRRIVDVYMARLPSLTPDWVPAGHPLVRFPVEVGDAQPVWEAMRRAGVDLGPRWFAAPVHPPGSRSTYIEGDAPNAERLARSVITLPTHPRVSPAEASDIAALLTATVSAHA